MKLYVSGSYAHKSKIQELVDFLLINVSGIEITSRWLSLPEELSESDKGFDHQFYINEDVEDVDRCDAVVLINTTDLSTTSPGKWIELGYALGQGKLAIVWGGAQTSLFLHDQNVVWLRNDDWSALVLALLAVRATLNSLDLEGTGANRTNAGRGPGRDREGAPPNNAQDRGEALRQGILQREGRTLSDLDRAIGDRASRTGGLADPTRG